jgi:hypothetical protein
MISLKFVRGFLGGQIYFLGRYMFYLVIILVSSALNWFPGCLYEFLGWIYDFSVVIWHILRFNTVSSVAIWVFAVKKTVSQLNNILQLSKPRQVSVAVCGRQCAADCRIVPQMPTHK